MTKTGIVKRFDSQKGWGFIIPDEGGPDIFVHYSNIVSEGDEFRTLDQGTRVEFTFELTGRGPAAFSVKALVRTETT